ncbi:hypothetical protein RI054_10g51970 [Pseudoscourfieldia marina]
MVVRRQSRRSRPPPQWSARTALANVRHQPSMVLRRRRRSSSSVGVATDGSSTADGGAASKSPKPSSSATMEGPGGAAASKSPKPSSSSVGVLTDGSDKGAASTLVLRRRSRRSRHPPQWEY